MRIGIDARELGGRPTGVGRYLASILREWAASGAARAAGHEIVLYVPAPLPNGVLDLFADLAPAVRVIPGASGTWWEQARLPRVAGGDRLDVFFAPAYTAPLRMACPTVLTIHDLSYLARPEWFRPRERWRRAWLTRAAARRAATILTDSAFSKAEIARLIPTRPERVAVIYLGLGLTQAVANRPREPLVLFVGSIFNRRRVPDLVEAFALVARQQPAARLAVVGENRTWPYEDVEALVRARGLEGRVSVQAWASDAELADLYARASVFVFLSEYEGFGLTPLEALASGVPVVVLDTPVAREIYEGAACYTLPGALADTARSILDLMAEGPARTVILDAAARLLPRYSWPRAAAETLDAIVAAAG